MIGRPIDIIDRYPVQLVVEYGDGYRNRLTTTFRWVLAIPLLILALAAGVGHITFAPFLVILFRKKFPHWLFHHQLELVRLEARIGAYLTFLTDEYPSSDEPQSVHLDMQYPDDETRLRRFLPLFKWFLATPHYFVLLVLFAIAIPVVVIAWLAILITGRYPQWLFIYIVGTMRWALRVSAYALFLVTDRLPPIPL